MSVANRPWFPFALAGLGLGVVVWATLRGQVYYYPGEPGQPLGDAVVEFVAARDGRYEIVQDGSAGDLTFTVVEADTDRAIPVDALGLLTALVQAEGRRAWAFEARAGQRYRVTTEPWRAGGNLTISYCDTRAVAWWTFTGLLLGSIPMIAALGIWFAQIFRVPSSGAGAKPSSETTAG